MIIIDLDRLLDPRLLNLSEGSPWTFLAFPRDSVGADGLPADREAQEYIAAVQSTGIPVGIWIDTPTKGVAYAFVGRDHIHAIVQTLEMFRRSGRFPRGYAERLTNRLLGVTDRTVDDLP